MPFVGIDRVRDVSCRSPFYVFVGIDDDEDDSSCIFFPLFLFLSLSLSLSLAPRIFLPIQLVDDFVDGGFLVAGARHDVFVIRRNVAAQHR